MRIEELLMTLIGSLLLFRLILVDRLNRRLHSHCKAVSLHLGHIEAHKDQM